MKTLTLTQRFLKNSRARLGMFAVGALVTLGLSTQAFALTTVSQQLDFGEKNADVTYLQQFFATTPAIYPEGLVTGYFGALTRSAVMRFQAQQGIVSSGSPTTTGYGRVGPSTLARINSMILGGTVPPVTSATGPAIVMSSAVQISSNSATFNWTTTNEVALGRVYYSTSPLQMTEGDINSNGFAVTSGQVGSYDGIARTAQTSTITGLQPNTTYYYTIVATDLSGNVSIIGPSNTFRTTN